VIKVNLLESVTDRNVGAAYVEDKVGSAYTQTFLLLLTVVALLVLGIGYDYVSANAQHVAATKELAYQRQLNDQMNTVKKEQAELEKRLSEINQRIDAIQKLRASQQGPSGVLAEIKARFDGVPGLYLKSVEQKDADLTIKGESPNEAAVTRFGQSMEFSSGLFTNLNIETTRQVAQFIKTPTGAPAQAQAQPAANGVLAALPEVVAFTIKCSYGPAKPPEPANTTPPAATSANHVAARN
jgi:Tfp pilus assembly protein PilN